MFGLGPYLTAGAGALAALGIFVVWLWLWHDPRVIREARREYVQIAQLEAEQAKSAELQRQVNAGAQAFEEYRKKLAAVQAQDALDDARHEKEIADYEKLVAAAGRACALDSDDLDFLRKP